MTAGRLRATRKSLGPRTRALAPAVPFTPRAVAPALVALLIAAAACQSQRGGPTAPATAAPALTDAFRDAFLVGAALNDAQFSGRDTLAAAIVRRHFNTITPENVLKWESVHPEPGRFDFAAPDRYVDFGERNGLFVVGHTLVWHSQTPRWVFQDAAGRPASRDTLLARMRDHIHTVVGRYRGRVKGWDVGNEALNEDGTLRRSPWLTIIGEDYIAQAFRFAHEADPTAALYYNDYSLDNAPKRDGAVALVRGLLAQGVPVSGIGTQQHNRLDWPSIAQVDSSLAAFGALGVKVMITELDVDVLPRVTRAVGAEVSQRFELEAGTNPYAAGLPDSVSQALARRYAELFAVYFKHRDVVDRVTFWGVRDGDSWLNDWPVRGRTSYPLLFDRQGRAKPAFDAVLRVAR
jgi:endo-1,4-beta-xylanase